MLPVIIGWHKASSFVRRRRPHQVRRRDRFGNYFRARVVVHLASGRETAAWDVFLAARLNGVSASAPALAGAGGTGPISAGLVGLGAGLVIVGFAGVLSKPRGRHGSSPLDVARGALSEGAGRPRRRADPCVGATGLTALAVVLLWPSATFGQTWQVVEYDDSDALGSIRAVTNQQGQVVARHDFLPFGEELNPQTPPHDKKLFTGQERDFETGQDYFNARQMRPDLGRFLTPDPIVILPVQVDSQGMGSYSYVVNNPLGLVDPSGLNPDWINAPQLGSDWTPTSLPDGAVVDPLGYNPAQNPTRSSPI